MKSLQNGDIKSLPGPDDIGRTELPNGITLLSRSNFNSPSVVMSGYFNAGSIFDTNEKLGLAYYTAVSVMRGTQDRTFHQIYDAWKALALASVSVPAPSPALSAVAHCAKIFPSSSPPSQNAFKNLYFRPRRWSGCAPNS